MLDSFLEISIASTELQRDMGRLEDFGFQSLNVNEIWQHQYGVMSDGHLHIGLHNTEFASPTVSFVLPELKSHIDAIRAAGVEFAEMHLSDEQFNHAQFVDRSGQTVRLLEARTYSPTLLDDQKVGEFGMFQHLLLPSLHDNDELWVNLQDTTVATPLMHTSEHCERLTAVYATDLEALVIRGTHLGWSHFSITQDDVALIKTDYGFDIQIKDSDE